MDPNQIIDIVTTLTRFVSVAKTLNAYRQLGRLTLKKSESIYHPTPLKNIAKQTSMAEVGSVRTRGQLKKHLEVSMTQEVSASEEKKPDYIVNMVLINVDVSDLLKKSIGLLVSVLPSFFRANDQLVISWDLLSNLFKIAC